MFSTRSLGVLLAGCLALGCAKKTSPSKTTDAAAADDPGKGTVAEAEVEPLSDAAFEAMMAKGVAMFTALGDAADQSGGDCDKLADALEQVMVDHADFMAQTKKYKGDPEVERKGGAWMQAHQGEVMGPMMKVATVGQKCAAHPKFRTVMTKLGELGD